MDKANPATNPDLIGGKPRYVSVPMYGGTVAQVRVLTLHPDDADGHELVDLIRSRERFVEAQQMALEGVPAYAPKEGEISEPPRVYGKSGDEADKALRMLAKLRRKTVEDSKSLATIVLRGKQTEEEIVPLLAGATAGDLETILAAATRPEAFKRAEQRRDAARSVLKGKLPDDELEKLVSQCSLDDIDLILMGASQPQMLEALLKKPLAPSTALSASQPETSTSPSA